MSTGGGAFGNAASRRGMAPLTPRKQGAANTSSDEPSASATAVVDRPEPAAEPQQAKPTTERRAGKSAARPAGKPEKNKDAARKVVNVQIPIDVWTPWDQLVVESGLRFRGDLINAALRALLDLDDAELGVEILAQTTGHQGAVKALSARVDVDLYAQLTARVKQGLGLPINAAIATALRRQHDAGPDALVGSVLAERRPS